MCCLYKSCSNIYTISSQMGNAILRINIALYNFYHPLQWHIYSIVICQILNLVLYLQCIILRVLWKTDY